MAVMLDELRVRARGALVHWQLPEHEPVLLKHRENAVFKVQLGNGGKAALRLHRPCYHSEAALRSELQFMDELRRCGLDVPRPLPTAAGDFLVSLGDPDAQFADVIGWVDGRQIGETGRPLDFSEAEIARIYHALGAAMADLHNIADRWTPPSGFARQAWDSHGLLGEVPLWGRFWDCPGLKPDDSVFLTALRSRLFVRLKGLEASLDHGLIHADLVRENVFVNADRVALIDFDDCGYGFRLFDIATALLRNRREPRFDLIKSSLIAGYRSRRMLGDDMLQHLPLFMLLRSLTYIGWAGLRPELPDAPERLERYVADSRSLAVAFEKVK